MSANEQIDHLQQLDNQMDILRHNNYPHYKDNMDTFLMKTFIFGQRRGVYTSFMLNIFRKYQKLEYPLFDVPDLVMHIKLRLIADTNMSMPREV